ncbi:AMP-binding protein [Kitasatospora sp. NPDC052896]|uniref:AMP-binding protein n=1 Tax=Kitasatospora sp. NPDC052896 TaxID=3364061 RepID=UPI0037C5352D
MSQEAAQDGPGATRTVHRLVEEQARRAPGAPAVRCAGRQLGYAELDERANQLARYLRQLGVARGDLVAVALGRSTQLLVALLAVLKADCAFVPVEPTSPDRLLRHVLATAEPVAVLTEQAHRVRLADATGARMLCLDLDAAAIADQPGTPPDSLAGEEDLACVFFTSASTGLPKGALLEHRNLLSALRGWQQVYPLTPADRHLQTTTFEFDVFTADWLRALGTGGTLVLAEANATLDRSVDLAALHRLVLAEGITVIGINNLLFRRLYGRISRLGLRLGAVRLLLVGAEKWYLDRQAGVQEYLGEAVRVLNIYGAAESGIDNLYFELSDLSEELEHPERVSLIGRPFPGTESIVVDHAGRPVGAGEPGELRLAGPMVGRGYLGEPKLTAARFPAAGPAADRRPFYRTGDLVRRGSHGLLEYLGRIDVDSATGHATAFELAELDGVLRSSPVVAESWVAELPAGGGRSPRVGYVVPADPAAPLDVAQLRAFVVERLPAGRGPDVLVPLPALPRTRAGKVDRAGLPLPVPEAYPNALPAKAGTVSVKARSASVKARSAPLEARSASVKARSAPVKASVMAVAPKSTPSATTPPGPGRPAWAATTGLFALAAFLLTGVLWPRSTALGGVPDPWATGYRGLHLAEYLAFGLGMAVLLLGRPRLAGLGRSPGRTTAAHLALSWLLIAWWPQDNCYRTTSADDWVAETALVYLFNVTLVLAAAVLLAFLLAPDERPR